jgi:hypothetical protein
VAVGKKKMRLVHFKNGGNLVALPMNTPPIKRRRILRRGLLGLGACLILIGLFYSEEGWRGDRAWKNWKRAVQAQGVKLDWPDNIPAPVPEEENVFGVPEMQKWFVIEDLAANPRGSSDFTKKLDYPGYATNRTARMVIARLMICLPGQNFPTNSAAAFLHWDDPEARAEVGRLMKEAVGPVVMDPAGFNHMLGSPDEIHPAQIVLQCPTVPDTNALLDFLPKPIANTISPDREEIQVEPSAHGDYIVTMIAPDTVAEFLSWSDQLEPDFMLIRKALQRPFIRMAGDYSDPISGLPTPNFVAIRRISQRLAAMAQCHLLQGKPEEALRDLTLMHDLCRILQDSQPMTMVSAIFNAMVDGLYVDTIADGLRWHVWHEPQLAALEEQMKQVNLLQPLGQAIETERVTFSFLMEAYPPPHRMQALTNHPTAANSWKDWLNWGLQVSSPSGWLHRNEVAGDKFFPGAMAALNPAGLTISPDKVDATSREAKRGEADDLSFTLSSFSAIDHYDKAFQTTARNQTSINQARIACALERYYLAHGGYPEILDALVPRFLTTIPHDVIGGQPPHYHRAADGAFVLYSVGWSGRDGGGVRGKTNTDGDWVWPDLHQ